MPPGDSRDLFSGLLLGAFGAFIAIYCATHYDLGRLTQLGPGLFPTALGVILASIGVAIAIGALFRAGGRIRIELRPALSVLAAVGGFAASIETLGLVPAIWILSLIASRADSRLTLRSAVLLAAALSALGAFIFQIGLGLPVDLVRWPL